MRSEPGDRTGDAASHPAPAFIHGDAFAGNVLVDAGGRCLALIDQGCARWSSLEVECSRLEDPASAIALSDRREQVGPSLVGSIRLDLLLQVALRGRASFDRARAALEPAVRLAR